MNKMEKLYKCPQKEGRLLALIQSIRRYGVGNPYGGRKRNGKNAKNKWHTELHQDGEGRER